MCDRADSDYQPAVDDAWPPCASDIGFYRPIQPTISTVSRVRAFEEIRTLLFHSDRDATVEDFVAARLIYQEDEGLDSRVVRRFDPHFEVPEGTDCSLDGQRDEFPDYCVGPAKLQPLLLGAFRDGVQGREPRRAAAHIEAGLLWFLYVSIYKEGFTCTRKAKDCDSAYAYYTGGDQARCGVGLSRYVQASNPYAHDRAWDGLLALRCWRDLDDGEVATDLAQRDLARNQYDQAVLHGVYSIVRQGLALISTTTGTERAYHHAFVRELGPVLERRMNEVDGEAAVVLSQQLTFDDPADLDVGAATTALDSVFVCP